MLLVVRTQPTVIRTPPFNRRIEFQRHLPRLNRLPRQLVIIRIGGNQHLRKPMLRTPLEHEHILILNHHLGLDLAKTGSAEAAGQLIKKIIAIAHNPPPAKLTQTTSSHNTPRTAPAPSSPAPVQSPHPAQSRPSRVFFAVESLQ